MGKILIADDEEDFVELLTTRFSANGHQTVWAKDGDEALKKIDETIFDLIILDFMMPGHDGYTICKQLKQSEKHKQIPVILMSAYVKEPDSSSRTKFWADAFFTKPFEMQKLVTEAESLMKKRLK